MSDLEGRCPIQLDNGGKNWYRQEELNLRGCLMRAAPKPLGHAGTKWLGRQDLNLRHLGPKPSILPPELLPNTFANKLVGPENFEISTSAV